MCDADPCQHDSWSGDEGPVQQLPGGLATVVRWRCDGCGRIRYDDASLDRLRAEVQRLREWIVSSWATCSRSGGCIPRDALDRGAP